MVTQMWFVMAFQRWRAAAVGRLRLKCMLGAHLERQSKAAAEMAFKAWRKVAAMRVRRRGQWDLIRPVGLLLSPPSLPLPHRGRPVSGWAIVDASSSNWLNSSPPPDTPPPLSPPVTEAGT